MKIWLKNSFSNGINSNGSFNDRGVWCASCTRHFELASGPYFRFYCRCHCFNRSRSSLKCTPARNMLLLSACEQFSALTINSNRHTSTIRREESFYLALLATIVVICNISKCGSFALFRLHHDDDDNVDKSIEGECIYFDSIPFVPLFSIIFFPLLL